MESWSNGVSEMAMTSPGLKVEWLTSSPTSLLNKFRALTQFELMQKQKVRVNVLPDIGTRKKRANCSTEPKGVSVMHRAKGFAGV